MKIKTNNIEFISFSDGKCDIYSIDDDENKTEKYNNLGFSKKVLGYKRYFAAAASQIQINRIIRIPDVKSIDTYDKVEIKNVGIYDIKMIQEINDTNPPCIELTLQIV